MSDEKGSHPTPKLDELEKGPWPSFIRDMKQVAGERPMVNDLLGQLELSYQEKRGHWKHGGVVGVRGYGGGVIGIWRDAIRIDPDAVREYAGTGLDLRADVCGRCPTRCMRWNGKALQINDSECNKCMHCINVMPKALRPGMDTGACILIGGKAPIIHGAQLSSVLVPFMKIEPPYAELKELLEKICEVWGENGMNRERVGELIQRVGLGNFLEEIRLEPVPQMVAHPRTNPYIFYEEYFVETGEETE